MIEMNYGPASKYYDLFASKDDLEFYKQLAIRRERKALELGVGTGRVAIELARAKVSVLGIDNSEYMLNVARKKLAKESALVRSHVRLKLADMRGFRLKDTFPFVYIASSTFEHCITDEDQELCLSGVYNAMEKGAVFAFDISQPVKKTESTLWIDRREVGEKEIVRTIHSRTDPQTNIVSVNLFFDVYQKGRLRERYYEQGKARISSRETMERMLTSHGFVIDRIFGDFDKSPYSKKSRRIIFVCTKS